MYLVYKTDVHHSYASREIIGLCTTLEIVVLICQARAERENEIIDEEQLWNLKHIRQTQNYAGPGEFDWEYMEVDVLI